MKEFSRGILMLILSTATMNINAQTKTAASLPRPKLVVGLVVDQMRWDYLYRYYERYGNGGFKRMLNEGFTCENTMINYLPAKTAIGHSSVYTGSVPAIHGIAGNDFIRQSSGASMYCVGDSTVQTVGSSSNAGRMSPANLLTTTVTDELKLANNFRSKVIGIALKDRGAILPAGHAADAAYWLDDSTTNWISSTWYMNALPDWVKRINEEKQVEKCLQKDWNTLYPLATYLQSTPDSNAYEKTFNGASAHTFPVKLAELGKLNGTNIIRYTPFGNSLTLSMAEAAVVNERMGKGSTTDFLAVSLSSTDYIGHQFGINAIEIEDVYLRLDKDLSDFFLFMDKQIGKGNYTVFLTADHGGAHNPGLLIDHKLPGGWLSSASLLKEANTLLYKEFGQNNIILSLANNEVHLNYSVINANKLDEKKVRQACVDFFQRKDGIAWAVDMTDIGNANLPDVLLQRLKNGYNRERSGAIFLILKSGFLPSATKTGTDHGNWNPYDTHIPLVWMGWGIHHGKTNRQTFITDIAPTLSALLHIQTPSGSIGEAIPEVLQ